MIMALREKNRNVHNRTETEQKITKEQVQKPEATKKHGQP